jgi:hypothetical protein
MAAVTEGFIFRVAAATEIERRELTLGVFFSSVIQNHRAPGNFIRPIFESFYRYVSHNAPPRWILLKNIAQCAKRFNGFYGPSF